MAPTGRPGTPGREAQLCDWVNRQYGSNRTKWGHGCVWSDRCHRPTGFGATGPIGGQGVTAAGSVRTDWATGLTGHWVQLTGPTGPTGVAPSVKDAFRAKMASNRPYSK
jgi:hypothetical protein